MRKKCTRILFTVLFIITIVTSLVLPSGALSYEHYPVAVELSMALLVNNQLAIYTPFEFSIFGHTRDAASASGYVLNNIYRFNVSHLMDPADFRYTDGIQVMFRGREGSGVLASAYASFEVGNLSYTAPSLRNQGSQFLRYVGSMDGVNDNIITTSYLTLEGGGYTLATSKMSESVNGVSSLRLSDVDVSRCRVKYDYAIFGIESLSREVNSIIIDVPFASNLAVIPVLPYSVLSSFWGSEDCYVDYCNVTVEMQTSNYQTAEYEGNFTFALYGGQVYSTYSDVVSLNSLFNSAYNDYYYGYDQGYEAGKNVGSQTSYQEGYDNGLAAGREQGYQQGINESWEDLNFTSWIGASIGGFMDTKLFGNFSIGGMLAVVVSLTLVLTFLKFFAGG